MTQFVYKPFGFYQFLGWLLIGIAVFICLLSYYFILPGLLLLIPAYFSFQAGKVTLLIDDVGIRLIREKSNPDRFIPWEQLRAYRLDSTIRGQDVILLSPVPLPPTSAKWYDNQACYPSRLWFSGILVIPLYSLQNTDSMRKFIYQKAEYK